MNTPAILVLEDGSIFEGASFGAITNAVGEIIFNTAITGYQEIITDPSYARQIVTLTHPQIGNTGVNSIDVEALRIHAAALVIKNLPKRISNWRAETSLEEFLKSQDIPGICGIDTRRLTRLIRTKGAQNACVMSGPDIDVEVALKKARQFEGLKGMDLAKVVSTASPYSWNEGLFNLEKNASHQISADQTGFKVAAFDFGVKQNILRMLVERGCKVEVHPLVICLVI